MAHISSEISNRYELLECLFAILKNKPPISRRSLCREYGINPVALHRYIHRPAHLRGKYVCEEHRREIEPIARQLNNAGCGIDAIVEALREQGITCSDYLVRSILRRHSSKNQEPPRVRRFVLHMFGGQGRDRTGDTRIFSPLLYQLSYLATSSC